MSEQIRLPLAQVGFTVTGVCTQLQIKICSKSTSR